MTVTWKQQIVAYCVLLVARMFAEDAQLVQDLRTLSNTITTKEAVPEAGAVARPLRPSEEFQVTSTPT